VSLTIRQRGVLAGLLAGRTNEEIAGDLTISRKTVEVHLSRLFTRTGSLSRTELAVKAEREGWLNTP
jgi:DNA-binding NarL/FixJ family response regulator